MAAANAASKLTPHSAAAQMALIHQQIKDCLDSEKYRIVAEIRRYPPPIPACDVQFNYLLDERVRIFQELGRVEELSPLTLSPADYCEWVEEFIRSSHFLAGDVAQKIRTCLAELSDAHCQAQYPVSRPLAAHAYGAEVEYEASWSPPTSLEVTGIAKSVLT